MLPYDSRKNYFGAENTRLADIFGEVLKLMPYLHGGWNYAAYRHDVDYDGTKKTGFFGRISNYFDRKKADKNFRLALEKAVMFAEDGGKISFDQANRAMKLAWFSYKAVRVMGWKFYKVKG
tara:strand:+ start:259 stop:621 length:363 start_codon:yes stop_codon:yes gene_type:complete